MIKFVALAMLCAVFVLGGRLGNSVDIYKMFPARSAKIVNGENISIEKVPWQVSLLEIRGSLTVSVCSGSIISSIWVVTAAHCIFHSVKSENQIKNLSAGSADCTKGSLHTIAEKICHPLFELRREATEVAVHDIALIRVVEPFVFDTTRQPIPLYYRAHATIAESQVIASGWGAVSTNSRIYADYLKSATMTVTSVQECKDFLSTVYEDSDVPTGQICVKGLSGRICYGDSGGPLVLNGTLIGINSWMRSAFCTQTHPSVSTEVARYRYWISEKTLI